MITDIRISICFKGHRKRRKLKKLLGPSSTDYLIDLWITVAQQRPKGVLYDFDIDDIADAANYTGDPEVFIHALSECGFIEEIETDLYAMHDWEKYQSWVYQSEKRSEKARSAAKARWDKNEQ